MKKIGFIPEKPEKENKVKVPDKSAGLGVKILSVFLAGVFFATMLGVFDNNYREIILSIFSGNEPKVTETLENVSSSEEHFIIPESTVKLKIDAGQQNFYTGDENTPLNDVSFNLETAYIDAGESTRLSYNKAPEEADISDLTWVSSDSAVLAVSNLGTVTGVSEGEAVISLYSKKYDVSASCTIYVKAVDEKLTDKPSENENETGFFVPPEDDDDGDISNNIQNLSSINLPSKVSSEESIASSEISSVAPNVSVSQISSVISSQVVSPISSAVSSSASIISSSVSSAIESTVTSLPVSSSNNSSENTSSTPANDAEVLANKYIKVKQNNGTYVAVTILDYLMYNTAVEMDARYSDEAIKAQIATIYTYYIIYNMSKGASYATMEGDRVFRFNQDGTVDFSKPKYHWPEKDGSFERLKGLCMEVLGQAVLYNGKGACTTFSHMNRGASQASSPYWGSEKIPYLTIVDSPWDKEAEGCERVRTMDKAAVYSNLAELVGEENLTAEPQYWFYEVARDVPEEGYVDYVTIGTKTVSGYKIRSKFSFRSNCFFAEYDAETETFTFTVYGNGHGIGFSQEGAEGMAKDGYKWDEILMHYYPGTKIQYKEPTFYEV